MDRQITIERKQITLDPVYGTELVTWIPLVAEAGSPTVAARFWAEVQDALPSRSEAVTQGLTVARNLTRVRLRWRDDIDSSMRVIVHGDSDVTMQIVAGPAEVDGRKGMLELVCERISS
jgi:head-tail adaptor